MFSKWGCSTGAVLSATTDFLRAGSNVYRVGCSYDQIRFLASGGRSAKYQTYLGPKMGLKKGRKNVSKIEIPTESPNQKSPIEDLENLTFNVGLVLKLFSGIMKLVILLENVMDLGGEFC